MVVFYFSSSQSGQMYAAGAAWPLQIGTTQQTRIESSAVIIFDLKIMPIVCYMANSASPVSRRYLEIQQLNLVDNCPSSSCIIILYQLGTVGKSTHQGSLWYAAWV